ncbi:MAG: hypothetical protein JJU28_20100 [Cyclobacteriaceae bacterium]|nr:hypothetical protein [Cyclobacteriaceae bacterium]
MNWSVFEIKLMNFKALFKYIALVQPVLKSLSLSILLCLSWILMTCGPSEKTERQKESRLRLENEVSVVEIERQGGAIASFRLKDSDINPLNWSLSVDQMPKNNRSGAVFKGHFLCIGRWGSPSAGEIQAGVPHNGEPSRDWWEVLPSARKSELNMKILAHLDGISVERTVKMDEIHPVFTVHETFTNQNTFGRISNVVQHVTLGPPFLSRDTRIYSNARAGFLQRYSWPDPYAHAFTWPHAKEPESQIEIDLQKSDYTGNYVSTHIFDDSTGWVVAHDPNQKLWIGYLWHTGEYPWINVWHQVENDLPIAKGIEFGTAGIGTDYKDLLSHDSRFFGRNSFEYMDAGEKSTKKYLVFLLEAPDKDDSVLQVQLLYNTLLITTAKGMKISMELSLSL